MISSKRKIELDSLLDSLNLKCDDYELLNTALTHSSYTFENKLSSLENNERLEFLGDAVLKLIASDYLQKRFPEYPEGELTKIRAILVSDNILTKISTEINLGKFLRLGFHEEKAGGRNRASTLACAFESLLGALYLDGKLNDLYSMLVKLLENEVTEIDQNVAKSNYKAMLQEYAQSQGLDLPVYDVIKEIGPAHDKLFEIEVIMGDKHIGVGIGKAKKEAQQKAAKMALESLGLLESRKENE